MNTRIHTLLLLLSLCILAPFTLTLSSCSESKAENADTAEFKVPYLKDRPETLGSSEERNNVAVKYDAAVAKVKANGKDVEAWLTLGEIFVNEARITGEHPYYYPAALEMIAKALACEVISPDQKFRGLYMRGLVEMSLHQFATALNTGNEAVLLNAYNAGVYGVLVDANVELGKYEAAVVQSDKMVSIRPDLRSYSRISYLREIHGDLPGAIEALKMAVDAGYPGYEQTSWCRLTLGNLYETYGDLDDAEMHYQISLQQRPNYPFAVAALGGIQLKRKNYAEAEKLVKQAIGMIPEVSFSEQLADIYLATDKKDLAEQTVTEVLTMLKDDADHGHVVDLEYAKVYLHYRNDADKALEYAMKEYQARPDNIDVNKILAEIWYRKGDFAKAGTYLDKAIRTNSKDPELLAIEGLIRIKQGQEAEGKKWIKLSMEGDPFQSFGVTPDIKALL